MMRSYKLSYFQALGLNVLYRVCFVLAAWCLSWQLAFITGVLLLSSLYPWIGEVRGELRRQREARGRKLLDESEVRKRCDAQRGAQRGVLWGKMRLPDKDATNHFCVVGAVGTGKTMTMRMLMRDQLPLCVPGSDRRALIYDPKQDMVQVLASALSGVGSSSKVWIMNPFDKRGFAWNIAHDVRTPADARQLAETLVPAGDKESQPFFSNAVRELLTAVVTVFVRTQPGKWTLRDVLLVMRSRELLRALLERHPFSQHVARSLLDAGEVTVGSVLATAATKLGPFEPIAAAWERASAKVSIQQWLHKDVSAIMILGNDERMRAVLDTVNQLFVALAAQQVLTMPESETRRTWFFFDEFSEAGRLHGLESVILRGRSKGCCVVLGFQDLCHVHEVYGEKLGNTLVGQCGNKAFLRIESPQTAKWASDSLGENERGEVSFSTTTAAGSTSQTASESRQVRAAVLPAEFMELPPFSQMTGLSGYYILRSAGAYKAAYSYNETLELIGPNRTDIPAFDPVDVDYQYLQEWTAKDAERLGLDSGPFSDSQGGDKPPPRGPSLDDFDRFGM